MNSVVFFLKRDEVCKYTTGFLKAATVSCRGQCKSGPMLDAKEPTRDSYARQIRLWMSVHNPSWISITPRVPDVSP